VSSNNILELEAERVRFYSEHDEAALFEWLKKIPCIKGCEGRGPAIYLQVDSNEMSESDLRELLAVFHRYAIPMRQLSIFERREFSEWFRDRRAYWYTRVFEEGS
jgi:hypothetical protein